MPLSALSQLARCLSEPDGLNFQDLAPTTHGAVVNLTLTFGPELLGLWTKQGFHIVSSPGDGMNSSSLISLNRCNRDFRVYL